MVRLLRHRQTKGPVSARLHLNRRATPRLHLTTVSPVKMALPGTYTDERTAIFST
jgi:hypothetical protein